MDGFKLFMESDEKDLKETLAKLPKQFRDLIKGYKFDWQAGNTLKNDDDHVGIINPEKKTVTIAAPYNYPREFTILHELGHQVFTTFVQPNEGLLKKWEDIVKKTENELKKLDKAYKKENAEESFCHSFAQHYCKTKLIKFDNELRDQFIDNLPS